MTYDIYKSLRDRIIGHSISSIERRELFYNSYRRKIIEIAKKNNLPDDHPKVSSFFSQLDSAIIRIEREITNGNMEYISLKYNDPVTTLPAPPAESTDSRLDRLTMGASKGNWYRGILPVGISVIILAFVAAYYIFGIDSLTSSHGKIAFAKNAIFAVSFETGIALRAGEDSMVTREWNHVRLSSKAAKPTAAGHTGGVFLELGNDIERLVSGKKIRVTVWARSADKHPSPGFAVAYSTAAVGNSGWKMFKLGAEVEPFRFEYSVPVAQKKPGSDFLGIWADTEGKGRSVDVFAIEISPVG
ncbi:MAG: hypothetical protein K8H74_13045 [Notoacmeibacter sp.]|nr:hypothetical protein [Notoacmeibacter sp.]